MRPRPASPLAIRSLAPLCMSFPALLQRGCQTPAHPWAEMTTRLRFASGTEPEKWHHISQNRLPHARQAHAPRFAAQHRLWRSSTLEIEAEVENARRRVVVVARNFPEAELAV